MIKNNLNPHFPKVSLLKKLIKLEVSCKLWFFFLNIFITDLGVYFSSAMWWCKIVRELHMLNRQCS